MRSSHDPYDFAAPSPIVPTSRTRQSHKANPFNKMPASTARHISSIANGDTDSKPLRLLGIISDDQHPDNPHKDSDVADLIRCLQSPSAATVTSASASAAASASASSLLTTTSASGARDMFKAGHRRLRQLAQRQRKDIDPSKADEEARQLSALQREGLLPSASQAPTLRRSPAKRKSAESSPAHSALTTHHQSNSRRDVERIGQPWLADPLERCMLDTLSSTGRLSSLDLGDLAAFMDTAALDEPEPKPKSQLQSQLKTQPEAQAESQQQQQQQQQQQPQPQPQPEPESIAELDTTKPNSAKTDSTEKKDEKDKDKRPQLKLFPDPLPPPRISSKAARRLSKCPPAQPAGLPPLTEMPSPPKPERQQPIQQSAEQPTAEPLAEPPENPPANTPAPADPPAELPAQNEQLPMHAIKAMFPMPAPTRPAPTRPLPAVPEIAPSETASTNPKKSGYSSPSSGSGSRVSQSPVLHQSPEPMRQSPPQTLQSHLQVTPVEPERRPRPFSFEASGESNENRQSVDPDHSHGHNHKERPQSPSAVSSPPTLASARPLNWHTKRSAPSLAPDTNIGSQIRRSNSASGHVPRSEAPVPPSDEEERSLRNQKRSSPRSSPQQKRNLHRRSRMSVARAAPPSPTRSPPSHHYDIYPGDSHANPHTQAHVHVLQARVAHLERQNKVLQAALLAALDAGNKDPSLSDGFTLSPPSSGLGSHSSRVLASAPAPTPVSRITPPSSMTTSASSMDERESEPRDDRRDTWLDLESRSRSSSGSSGSSNASSFDFSATTKALEGIHDVDFGWLSDRSSFVH